MAERAAAAWRSRAVPAFPREEEEGGKGGTAPQLAGVFRSDERSVSPGACRDSGGRAEPGGLCRSAGVGKKSEEGGKVHGAG